MKYAELRELGNEATVRAAGKYRTEGKGYVVEDSDILFIKVLLIKSDNRSFL